MLLTLTLDITGESVASSNKAVKMIMYVHRLTLLFIQEYPQLSKAIESKLENFINDEALRVKEATPNLGELMVYLCLQEKYTWECMKEAFLQEHSDRQIFWILKEFTELE